MCFAFGKEAVQKEMKNDLTGGNVFYRLLRFSLPFLLSSFLQTFYGLADLYITGQFNGADTISAVSVGSQITHMVTVIIVGIAMGTTVVVGRAEGAKDRETVAKDIINTLTLFAGLAVVLTVVLLFATGWIVSVVSVPSEAVEQTGTYLRVCFLGVPFIVAYNVFNSIFRGLGDSRTPMYFVAVAGVINIVLDFCFIGPLGLGALGAGLATVMAQGCSVLLAVLYVLKKNSGISVHKADFKPDRRIMGQILKVGIPTAAQDGFIQISFLVITAIANSRGVQVSAAVGIVEKLISFFFLVPSAMLASVSAMVAQNAGAGEHERGKLVLFYGIGISVTFGLLLSVICQFCSEQIVGMFTSDEPRVILLGGQYLRSYIFDCALAGIHFCFSGYFCAYGKAGLSFFHNVLSVLLIRIPGAYLASVYYPETLYPMGLAPALGSLFSAVVCVLFFYILQNKKRLSKKLEGS